MRYRHPHWLAVNYKKGEQNGESVEERGERERERDLELNLRGSPQARRRQVPRPPRKTTPLCFKLPFFFPSLLHSLPWTVSQHFCSCTSFTRSSILPPVRAPILRSPDLVRLYFRLFTSPRFALPSSSPPLSLSLSLSLFSTTLRA